MTLLAVPKSLTTDTVRRQRLCDRFIGRGSEEFWLIGAHEEKCRGDRTEGPLQPNLNAGRDDQADTAPDTDLPVRCVRLSVSDPVASRSDLDSARELTE
jgi:hypothetical protein